MTPHLRPIGALTPEILGSSSHWCLLYDGNADIRKASALLLSDDGVLWCKADDHSDFYNDPSTCYPCEPLPPFEPLPWLLLPGEDEIEDWRGCDGTPEFGEWFDGPLDLEIWALRLPTLTYGSRKRLRSRLGFHPSPRYRINPDGTVTPVWVWEADHA